MKLFKYIWRNISRNKVRSLLTILSVGFSLALTTVLYGFRASQVAWQQKAEQENRIVAMNVQGFSGRLPIAAVDDVRAIEHVTAAVPYAWFGGEFEQERMPFAQFATDPEYVFDVWPKFEISPDQLSEFKKNRRGAVLDARIAQKRNWNIGQKFTLKGTFYPVNLELELVGTFKSDLNTDSCWFHWAYLDESLRAAGRSEEETGNSGTIFALVDQKANIPAVIKAVDDRFASSQNPTRSQTEAAFATIFTEMLGDIQLLIMGISALVVLCLILVAANSMAMAMRERVTEIAVLKAIGFERGRVLLMVLGEAVVVAVLGGVFGLTLGCGLLQLMNMAVPQFFPFTIAEMAGPWMSYALLMAAGVGLISGLVPAFRAANLSVIDGLRRVA
jgi:putative ABC transport system permease protein